MKQLEQMDDLKRQKSLSTLQEQLAFHERAIRERELRKVLLRGEKRLEGELVRKQAENYVQQEKNESKLKAEKTKEQIKEYIAEHQRIKLEEQQQEKLGGPLPGAAHLPFDKEEKRYRDKFKQFNERARRIQDMCRDKKNLSQANLEYDRSLERLIKAQEAEKRQLEAQRVREVHAQRQQMV